MTDDDERPQGTMRMHPDMPRPNIPDEIRPDAWCGIDRSDYAGARYTYSKVSKAHWESIFGKRT
jgi:hypothetical protein